MFKKNKQLIIGFILGALLFTIVPVGATVQDYLLKKSTAKLMVDGNEFLNKELPVLNYQGYNYIPAATFREICDTIDVEFEWVGEKNEIQIDTRKDSTKTNISQQPSIQEDAIINTEDENIVLINGVKHISRDGINDYLRNANENKKQNEKHYLSPFKDYTNKIYTLDGENTSIIIDDVPIKRVYGKQFYNNFGEFIEYDFFQNTIAPLTK